MVVKEEREILSRLEKLYEENPEEAIKEGFRHVCSTYYKGNEKTVNENNSEHKAPSYFYAPIDSLSISKYDSSCRGAYYKGEKSKNFVKVNPLETATLENYYFGNAALKDYYFGTYGGKSKKVNFSDFLDRLYFEYVGQSQLDAKEYAIKELFTGETFKISGPIESNVAKGYGNMSISGIKPISANNLLDFILSMSNNGCIDIYAEAVNNMFRENRDAFNDSKLIHEKLDGIVAEVRQRVFNHDIK